ncbi:hypothetical protein ABZ930_36485 [Streptomyces sp. NPDC046716]|uniref:hypothetical protein n=1 Tax=Streptomyces sp. NPDC046716 TaxID=3157093 RepID=UPI0033CFB65F
MPDTSLEPTNDLQTHYASQVAADLERVGAEISALEQQLERLRRDHALLIGVQNALGDASANGPDAPSVPKQSRPGPAAPARRTKPARKKPAPKAPPKVRPARTADKTGPTVADLVRAQLSQEPRSTVEITDALTQTHPDHPLKNTVVRSTVENLVARGQAQRTKQGRNVFYTATAASGDTDAPATAED